MTDENFEETYEGEKPMNKDNETSTMEGKWHNGIDGQGLQDLNKIRDQITETMDEAVITVARARLRIGTLLGEARKLFSGDKEFGQWRKATIPMLAPRTANTYMNMARVFKNAPELVETVGWSKSREFLSVDEDLQKPLAARLEKGKATAAEVEDAIEAKREATGASKDTPPPAEVPGTASESKGSQPVQPEIRPGPGIDERIDTILQLPTEARVRRVKNGEANSLDPLSQNCIVLGLPPGILERVPNQEIWDAIVDAAIPHDLDQESADYVKDCATEIEDYWKQEFEE